MTQRPKYNHSTPSLSPAAPTIIQKTAWGGECAERQLKKPREYERENIDICTHHCQHPDKPCSGTAYRMEKCREEYERKFRE